MTSLSPDARALLDAARSGLSPDAAATARVRAKVASSVAGGAAGGAGAKLAIASKLAIVAVIGAVVAGAYMLTRDEPEAAAPVVGSHRAPPSAEVAAPVADSHRASPPAIDPAIEIESAPARTTSSPTRPPSATSSSGRVPAETPARAAKPADLAREVALIDRAMAALRGGDGGGALDAIRIYDAETGGRGQLAEDAAAIAVEALCQRGDAAAGAKLDAFDHRWPRSAQRARLSAACRR